MLNLVGPGSTHTCDGVSRRDFLQAGSLGAIGLSMADIASMPSTASAELTSKSPKDDRACIMIFNLGAPSQLDTFDPKPDAPREIRGPFQPIATKSRSAKSSRNTRRSPTTFRSCEAVTTERPRYTTPVGK